MADAFELVIKGGNIVDGTGSAYFRKDIGISEGKIKKVGIISTPAGKIVDAKGMVVSPGFIDPHGHSDRTILAFPNCESFIMQGITTAVVGNCGISLAPINPATLSLLQKSFSASLKDGFDYGWEWRTLGQYYQKVQKNSMAMNVAPLIGQGTVRIAVKGFDSAKTTRAEMNEMKKLVAEGMEEGMFGMSTGLVYVPGNYCPPQEIEELASVLTRYGGIYTSHMRDEESRLMQSVEETIRVGEVNNIPVEISHHKVKGKSNWGKVNATLREMENARKRGIEVNCDVYPYPASSTSIAAIMPTWILEGGIEKMVARLKDQKFREQAKKEMLQDVMSGTNYIKAAGWRGVLIADCPANRDYEGKSLEQILIARNAFTGDAYEGFFDLVVEINGTASIIGFTLDEADVRTVISHPLSAICTDGTVTSPASGGKPHPRNYGTFPRVLAKYVREEKLLSLEEAIRKMTSLPAGKFGIQDRGILREGFRADVVIFDPLIIKDKATFDEPHQYPEGIRYVIVNGQIVVNDGRMTGARPGKVLKRD